MANITTTGLTRKLHIIILLALLIRVILTFTYQTNWDYMNPDEERSYTIAQNYNWGHGYALWSESNQRWEQTAFHAPFNTFIYIKLQQWGIAKLWWVMFIDILSLVAYGFGAVFLFKLAKEVLQEVYAFWAAVTYLFFPSMIFYIGILFAYENIMVPLIVIAAWQLVNVMKQRWQSYYWVTLPTIVTISVLMRPGTLAVYAYMMSVLFIIALLKKNNKYIILSFVTLLLLVVAHYPSLKKNYDQFGKWTMSNQGGYELMQGHSDVARGSWRGGWQNPDNVFYQYSEKQIPGVNQMDEHEGSVVRSKFAKNWILTHPVKELELCARKIAIFFLPKNYEVLPTYDAYNPINAAVYALAIFCFFILIIKRKMNTTWFIIAAPLIGTLILSLVFFVSYRARYFAEPFMCIMALWPVQRFFNKRKVAQANS